MNKQLTCFKAYDVRGELGEELNDDIAYRVGRAFAQHLGARRVVIGGDIRLSSESLKQALAKGLMDAGADVIDLGMTGTEEIYFAAFHLDVDGGIEVTASHNPINYNGMKFVARDAKPISGDTGLKEIQRIAEAQSFDTVAKQGSLEQQSILNDYAEHLLGYINTDHLKPLKLVVNAGNGAAGHVIDALEQRFNDLNIPIQFVKIHHQPDGTFPNGIPNPLLPENREATTSAVIDNQADMGIAWDGDFDRCFLFDEKGAFIEGYYVVGLLAEVFLHEAPEEKIIHDPRLIWNTQDVVNKLGGIPIQSKTGHAFIKERMRMENAVYGGEMSAHHYFRDFAYCDSGMIPWLLVSQLLSEKKACLSELVVERMLDYPCSGEINYQVANAQASIDNVVNYYLAEGCGREEVLVVDRTDGISLEFSQWRFNLRSSNTESLLRLNVESRADSALVDQCVLQIEALINLRK